MNNYVERCIRLRSVVARLVVRHGIAQFRGARIGRVNTLERQAATLYGYGFVGKIIIILELLIDYELLNPFGFGALPSLGG